MAMEDIDTWKGELYLLKQRDIRERTIAAAQRAHVAAITIMLNTFDELGINVFIGNLFTIAAKSSLTERLAELRDNTDEKVDEDTFVSMTDAVLYRSELVGMLEDIGDLEVLYPHYINHDDEYNDDEDANHEYANVDDPTAGIVSVTATVNDFLWNLRPRENVYVLDPLQVHSEITNWLGDIDVYAEDRESYTNWSPVKLKDIADHVESQISQYGTQLDYYRAWRRAHPTDYFP
jgi:hypothetical protein